MSNVSQSLPSSGILKDMQILVVDNDVDTRYLYSTLFESYGAKVTALELVTDALTLLEWFTPDILVCEIRFLGEDIWPLVLRVKAIALDLRRVIPVLAASAYPLAKLEQTPIENIAAHLLKPVDINCLVDQVWNLTYLSMPSSQPNSQDWALNQRFARNNRFAEVNPF